MFVLSNRHREPMVIHPSMSMCLDSIRITHSRLQDVETTEELDSPHCMKVSLQFKPIIEGGYTSTVFYINEVDYKDKAEHL